MASFLEYILASISSLNIFDFKFLGLHRLVWSLVGNKQKHREIVKFSILEKGTPLNFIFAK